MIVGWNVCAAELSAEFIALVIKLGCAGAGGGVGWIGTYWIFCGWAGEFTTCEILALFNNVWNSIFCGNYQTIIQ